VALTCRHSDLYPVRDTNQASIFESIMWGVHDWMPEAGAAAETLALEETYVITIGAQWIAKHYWWYYIPTASATLNLCVLLSCCSSKEPLRRPQGDLCKLKRNWRQSRTFWHLDLCVFILWIAYETLGIFGIFHENWRPYLPSHR
jgi:hypothetical protein